MNILKFSLMGGAAVLALAACSPSTSKKAEKQAPASETSAPAASQAKAPAAAPKETPPATEAATAPAETQASASEKAATAAASATDAAKAAATKAADAGKELAGKAANAASDMAGKTAATGAATLGTVAKKAGLNAGDGTGGDAAAGKLVFNKCHVCHSAVKGQMKVGPSLFGVIGRTPGTLAGYQYSPAMAAFGKSGKTWNAATLNTYLSGPQALVPKIKMFFPGLPKEKDRKDVIAYLSSLKG